MNGTGLAGDFATESNQEFAAGNTVAGRALGEGCPPQFFPRCRGGG